MVAGRSVVTSSTSIVSATWLVHFKLKSDLLFVEAPAPDRADGSTVAGAAALFVDFSADGEALSVDWAEKQWWDGGYSFKKGGRPPEIQKLGNWNRPSGKGRTVTIGQRTSSKFCRFYEKGKKEGDKASTWCRSLSSPSTLQRWSWATLLQSGRITY